MGLPRLRLSKFFSTQRCTGTPEREQIPVRRSGRYTEKNFLTTLCVSLCLLCASLCPNLLTSCQSASDLNPKAPKERYTMTEADVRNDRYLSTVHVPVSIALSDVERQINAQVVDLIYEDKSLTDRNAGPNDNDQFMAKVWKRGNILVTAEDSLFHFTVPLKIWAKAGVSVLGFTQYKETEFEIDLRFKSKFDIDPDWSVHTQTQSDGYGWVRRPTVSVVGINVPITNIVGRLIDRNLGSITKTIDQQVRQNIDLRTPILKAWNTLREPYLISEQYRTYLQVVPRSGCSLRPSRRRGGTSGPPSALRATRSPPPEPDPTCVRRCRCPT